MNIKGFRRMLFGEKMPDKNDPEIQRPLRAGGVRWTKVRPSDTH